MTDRDSTHRERMRGSQERFVLPAGAREVILVRHGASVRHHEVQLPFGEVTLADPPLSAAGEQQARAVAARLAGERLTGLFVTPLRRTHATAAPLEALTGLRATVIEELREVHLGDWEHDFYGRVAAEDPLLKRMYGEESWDMIPNAEPMAAFGARVRRGIERIVTMLEPGCTAAAFVHGGTIGEACRQATASRPFAFFGPENTSLTRLIVQQDGRWALRSFNDVAHL